MPTDFKRVLQQRMEASEDEDEGDEAQVAISF